MKIAGRSKLQRFWRRRPEVKSLLETWCARIENSDWDTPARALEEHPRASIVSRDREVFRIRGNRYRMVVKIFYFRRIVEIRFIGDHEDYDRINAEAMATVKPIRTEEDYEAALERVSELMEVVSGPEGQIEDPSHPAVVELGVLVDLVELYEERHYPIDPPTAAGAIEYEMDRLGMKPRDLIPIIGSRSKVSEVLSGKREITMSMARALHKRLGIDVETLVQEPLASRER